jgi:hypothetical protein
LKNWKKSKDKEFRKIMEPAPASETILFHHSAQIYSQAEQPVCDGEEADPAGKIPFYSSINRNEISFFDPGVLV